MRSVVCATLLLLSLRVGAEEGERPWAEGVSPADQAEALTLYETGNKHFEQGQHAQALVIYRHAVAAWDHPAIRYNMAVAHIHLDRPLAAFEDLERAMRFGGAPLDAEMQAQARTYQKLLAGQLSRLTVVTREPGAEVFLDGARLLVGPGEATRVLLPGTHQLVASKARYLTSSRVLSLLAGQTSTAEIEPTPMPLPRPTVVVRRWGRWTPWVIASSGAALALLGVPLQLASATSYESYADAVTLLCPRGCPLDTLPGELRRRRSRAAVMNRVGAGMIGAGAVIVAGGLIMVLLNQPRTLEDAAVSILPSVVEGSPGLVVSGAF